MENIIKTADDVSCNSNMSPEFVNDRKKKRDQGKTEGQAVLEWLAENSVKNKSDVNKKANTWLGRPV